LSFIIGVIALTQPQKYILKHTARPQKIKQRFFVCDNVDQMYFSLTKFISFAYKVELQVSSTDFAILDL
jgi:hypothetical protein